ncbi:MAG: ABC-2 family transporter protein [Pseudomonadota bacterium]
MSGLRLYLRYLGVSIRSQMQYRASFFAASLGTFIVTGVEAVGIWALFERFGHLTQWTLSQVALFYGLVNIAFAFTDALARGFDLFGAQFVKTGNFDRLLVRPRSTFLQLAGHEFTLYRVGRLTMGVLVLAYALATLDLSWGIAEFAVFLFALVGAFLFFYGLIVIQATISFWTTESLEIMNALTYGGVETAQYPLAIYREGFRRFFTYAVPLGCVSYFPMVYVLGIDDPLGSSRLFQAASPLAGFLFFGLTLLFWRFGLRRYASTGS